MRKGGFYVLVVLAACLLLLYFAAPFGTSRAAGDNSRSKIPTNGQRQQPANFDALAGAQSNLAPDGLTRQVEGGRDVQTEPRLGVPTFLWASDPGPAHQISKSAVDRGSDEVSAARSHLSRYADRYHLAKSEIATVRSSSVHDTGSGAIIVKFKQDIGGVEVFRDEVNVIMNRDLQLVAISGYLTGADTADKSLVGNFPLQPEAALSAALGDLTGQTIDPAGLHRVTPGQNTTVPTSEPPTKTVAPILGKGKSVVAPTLVKGGGTITVSTPQKQLPVPSDDPYTHFSADNAAFSGFSVSDESSRTRPVMFHLPDRYVPAYYVETSVQMPSTRTDILNASGDPVMENWNYSYVISAVDGQVLFRKNLVAEQTSTYNVWADPTTKVPYDTPAGNGVHPKITASPDGTQYPFTAQQTVTLQSFPFSQNDPWLAAGAIETNGNNADAYLDLFGPDGFGSPTTTIPTDIPTGDFRAQATGPNAFQHTFVAGTTTSNAEARQSAIQQIFYNINFLHDWYYDSGFNEAAGNAQTNNFGRGGVQNDNIRAEAQDSSGFSNANMSTPADGGRPRMQMFIFPSISNVLDVQSTPAAAGKRSIGVAMIGPQSFDVTGQLVNAVFSASPTCTVTNAAALAGKLALTTFDNVDGSGCSFVTRIANISAQTTTLGTVMMYTSVGTAANGAVNITGFTAALSTIDKPFASISWNGSATIRSELAASQVVTARLFRAPDRDGTLDNQVMFHEWGHYISNRLVGNSAGINTNMSGGMGEGWGDFDAMMLTVRADDTATASNATWNGAYALATYATSGVDPNGNGNNGYYYGIRRVPYSTDMSIDPLTYKHTAENIPITGAPLNFGASGVGNSEVHNTGEVWATMLWECYASLLRDTQGASPRLTFDQAQSRMKNYYVAAFKMTPNSPTFLEARDAMLAAAYANDPVDGALFSQAFAKRGAGAGAISPDRFSNNNVGVVESFTVNSDIAFVSAVLDDSIASHDHDGYLDDGETGLLTFSIRNSGVATLSGPTSQISCDNPGVSFPDGNSVVLASLQPASIATATVKVHMEGQSGLQTPTFTITSSDPTRSGGPVVGTYTTYAYANDIPVSTRADTVEPRQTAWTITNNPAFDPFASSKFRRQAQSTSPLNYSWSVPDVGVASDQYLTSPVMTVNGSNAINIQFDHTFGFEFDAGGNYDGGVVEMSVNGGAFADIGGSTYNGTILSYTGDVNPLKGRAAFVKSGSGHVSLTQAVNGGSTVQVRFRFASDSTGSAAGWSIDNIGFTGIVETPFSTLAADPFSAIPFVGVGGRVTASNGSSISQAVVTITDGVNTRSTRSNAFGYFRFDGLANNLTYTIQVTERKHTFTPQVVTIHGSLTDVNFVAN